MKNIRYAFLILLKLLYIAKTITHMPIYIYGQERSELYWNGLVSFSAKCVSGMDGMDNR